MSRAEIVSELESLPPSERAEIIKSALVNLCPHGGKVIERMIRRLENPDISEDVWRGMEDAEDGRFVDMEAAMTAKPPWVA